MVNKMLCVFASNLLNDAAFIKGREYECFRDNDKNVFVKCEIGMNIQLQIVEHEGKSAWGCDNNGGYKFIRITK